MGEAHQEVQLQIIGQHEVMNRSTNTVDTNISNNKSTIFPHKKKNLIWWIRISIYIIFVLVGQSVATLLGRLYYDRGGHSKWMGALVQPAGFPILLPLYLLPSSKPQNLTTNNTNQKSSPSLLIHVALYISFGILFAVDSMMYSIGYMYIPVSTYSLICASQLGFNAFFSFFLNSLKFTAFITNSIVLLTTSSTLLVFQPENNTESMKVSKGKYAIGFLCTLGASAGYGLMLSLTQVIFKKVLKKETFKAVLNMIIYPSIVSTCVIVIGLFASGEWRVLSREMDGFQLGRVSYVMTLVWTAVSWQVYAIGAFGLIFEVSSLFSNVISTLGLPAVPVLAVVFFHESMNGVKVVALVLAVWGFVSYIYQHYLDDRKSKIENGDANQVSKASSTN